MQPAATLVCLGTGDKDTNPSVIGRITSVDMGERVPDQFVAEHVCREDIIESLDDGFDFCSEEEWYELLSWY